MQRAERKIQWFWGIYEGETRPGIIHYPEEYSLLTDGDRQEPAKELKDLMPMVPSITFRREAAKRIAKLTLGSKVSADDLRKIEDEIDSDPVVIGDPAVIEQDVVNGLVDPETASLARGYPAGTAAKAEEAHARRLARIAEHQSKPNLAPESDPGARGIPDQSGEPQAGEQEKTSSQVDQTTRDSVKSRTRGEGK